MQGQQQTQLPLQFLRWRRCDCDCIGDWDSSQCSRPLSFFPHHVYVWVSCRTHDIATYRRWRWFATDPPPSRSRLFTPYCSHSSCLSVCVTRDKDFVPALLCRFVCKPKRERERETHTHTKLERAVLSLSFVAVAYCRQIWSNKINKAKN